MKITKIYEAYKIIPNLREHQLRVAGAAKLIAENTNDATVNVADIVLASLLHDMGKIVAFKLKGDELIEYGEVQATFKSRYGDKEDEATYHIAKELGVSDSVMSLIKSIGFAKAEEVKQEGNIGNMICLYADQRVAPKGVVSLDERFAEGSGRFRERMGSDPARETLHGARVEAIRGIERSIFDRCSLKPESLTDGSIQGNVQELAMFDLPQLKLPHL